MAQLCGAAARATPASGTEYPLWKYRIFQLVQKKKIGFRTIRRIQQPVKPRSHQANSTFLKKSNMQHFEQMVHLHLLSVNEKSPFFRRLPALFGLFQIDSKAPKLFERAASSVGTARVSAQKYAYCIHASCPLIS